MCPPTKNELRRIYHTWHMESAFSPFWGGVLSSAVELPSIVRLFAWPLLLGVALALSALAVWQYRLQATTEPPASTPSRQNRQWMLKSICSFWITGVLEQSLHSEVPILL